jgi:serine/threonine protein phosphatase PrpC
MVARRSRFTATKRRGQHTRVLVGEYIVKGVAMRFRAAMGTDPGVARPSNEDVAHVDPAGRFVILADGMGGPGAGDVAATTAVDVVKMCLESYGELIDAFSRAPSAVGRDKIHGLAARAVQLAHNVILERQRKERDKHRMGTTLDLVVIAGTEAFVIHVGDSRTYLVRDGIATQVTADHTVAEMMKRSGAIIDSVARESTLRSILSSAIGMPAGMAIDHATLELRPGDRLLICSDGLHDYFTREDLAARLSIAALDAAVDDLIAEARDRGGHDNITAIIVETFDPAKPIAGVPDGALDSLVEDVLDEMTQPHRS